ncbi:MAG TPA: undecaprenyl-diphosphatase UppP [Anaerolineaceae bacterium]|nr:undecaprenyl-diphosphatase UppP [Anaerolineaceae bacterium]
MTFIQALILGIIQGLTEFLPISSTAHLVILPFLLKWDLNPAFVMVFNTLIQLGTLAAVIVYFWHDLITILKAWFEGIKTKRPFDEPNSKLGWLIILATIPAGLFGLLLQSKVRQAMSSAVATAVFLFVTAILLTAAEIWSRKTRQLDSLKPLDAGIIGLFQAVSIFPGISRSGATISGGQWRGLTRESAAKFSFLMSIPIMLAAGALEMLDLFKTPGLTQMVPQLLIGFIIAGVVGYFSIRWFLRYLKSKSLLPFALYCAVLAIVVIFVASGRTLN